MSKRPFILSIAGFDPSGGAGVIADAKTFEQHNVQGLFVLTANTIQTAVNFNSVNWVDDALIIEQLHSILDHHPIKYVKIGLIRNIALLEKLVQLLIDKDLKIVWDPILIASSGFKFHKELLGLEKVLKKIHYITPNWLEIKELSGEEGVNGAKLLSSYTKVYLKGGHSQDLGKDYLVTKGNIIPFKMAKKGFEKHGSGCIFSSSLTANLLKGYPEIKACLRAKRYTELRLASNRTLLAYHHV
ncbi:hydroxymethylpyrimidine/phosphomethylpyrimidine kinase [Flavobacteriales bacterium]|nr:hydroxymethylpyrimidine/phosphomethylpyrimidine kinase [Flavobacteriales bacterium]MDC3338199.1 hydroxymethylpyrimidine/phosphomethylpyrimidine kinase [Flavobacteriales bacterium]